MDKIFKPWRYVPLINPAPRISMLRYEPVLFLSRRFDLFCPLGPRPRTTLQHWDLGVGEWKDSARVWIFCPSTVVAKWDGHVVFAGTPQAPQVFVPIPNQGNLWRSDPYICFRFRTPIICRLRNPEQTPYANDFCRPRSRDTLLRL